MSADPEACAICGERGHQQNPLAPDEYHRGAGIHLYCLNSPEGRVWHESRCAADPQYARYSMLITVGREVSCPSCGTKGRLSPKGYGMGAGRWEANCTHCHAHSSGLNAYRSPAEAQWIQRLQHLWQRFKIGVDEAGAAVEIEELEAGVAGEIEELEAGIADEIEDLDRGAESGGPGGGCACGGTYSISARPRCVECSSVLLDSPFHISLASAPEARQ